MKETKVCKANGQSGGVLSVQNELPDDADVNLYPTVFQADAIAIETFLHDTLPGGTYDRLLGYMLKRTSSHFIVSYGDMAAIPLPPSSTKEGDKC